MEAYPFQKETYQIIGICMEIQKILGFGFSEIIYKDAIELEFLEARLLHRRESELEVEYKGKRLRHKFFADFNCFDNIIVEVKACDKGITADHIAQTLNYLRVSGNTIGLIINFGKRRLEYKRLIANNPR